MATLQGHPAYRMGERYGEHPDDDQYPGKLIIVEGIDGSGKSTQIDLLQKWLRSRNLVTVYTEWNSSPIVKRTTKQAKVKELLTPMSFSLIHAADFASRVHAQILPALRAGGNRAGRPLCLYRLCPGCNTRREPRLGEAHLPRLRSSLRWVYTSGFPWKCLLNG